MHGREGDSCSRGRHERPRPQGRTGNGGERPMGGPAEEGRARALGDERYKEMMAEMEKELEAEMERKREARKEALRSEVEREHLERLEGQGRPLQAFRTAAVPLPSQAEYDALM